MAACDLSGYSEQILKHAVEITENLSAELIIVNVINQRDVDAMQRAIERIAQEAERFDITIEK